MSVNITHPNVVVESSPLGATKKFTISIQQINELDSNNKLIRSIDLGEVEFTLEKKTQGSNTVLNYTSPLDNGAWVSVIVS